MPTLEQLQEAVQRDRAETLSTEAARREQAARRKRELEELDARMEREWYSDDPQWQATHRNVDDARDEQLAARRYQEQQERGQKAYDLSTQGALDEKLAAKKRIAIQPIKEYDENDNMWNWITKGMWEWAVKGSTVHLPYQKTWNSVSQDPRELMAPAFEWIEENFKTDSPQQKVWESIENNPNGFEAIKNYYESAKRVSPTQFQLVVDTQEEMLVHTVIHLGNIAWDAVGLVGLGTGTIATAAASATTCGASAILAAFFLEEATRTGVSLASEVADTIQDIASYYKEGRVIVTMGPDSEEPEDVITWFVL